MSSGCACMFGLASLAATHTTYLGALMRWPFNCMHALHSCITKQTCHDLLCPMALDLQDTDNNQEQHISIFTFLPMALFTPSCPQVAAAEPAVSTAATICRTHSCGHLAPVSTSHYFQLQWQTRAKAFSSP